MSSTNKMLEALQFYANADNWKEQETGIGMTPSDAEMDGGRAAREAIATPADLQARLERERGICTNIIESEAENIRRIRFILSAYEQLLPLQYAERNSDKWESLHDLPSDFNNFKYRLAR